MRDKTFDVSDFQPELLHLKLFLWTYFIPSAPWWDWWRRFDITIQLLIVIKERAGWAGAHLQRSEGISPGRVKVTACWWLQIRISISQMPWLVFFKRLSISLSLRLQTSPVTADQLNIRLGPIQNGWLYRIFSLNSFKWHEIFCYQHVCIWRFLSLLLGFLSIGICVLWCWQEVDFALLYYQR